MPAATQPGRPAAAPRRGCYVYRIVPHDVEPVPGAKGVGDPPARVQVVRHGGIAALVSEIDLAHQRGQPEDLRAHQQLLDGAATEVPVLAFRFGAV
jgi:Gas vesicle synthesis protein GvpL/GvpF